MAKVKNNPGEYVKREVEARGGRAVPPRPRHGPADKRHPFFTAPMDDHFYLDLRRAPKPQKD